MRNTFEILEAIRQRPGLYLGSGSVTTLRHFLVGYKFARQEMNIRHTEDELDFYHEFQPWLQQKFQLRTTNSWDKILLFIFINEDESFQQFFTLLEEFRLREKHVSSDDFLFAEDEPTFPKQVA
jgi:hypothetical protein